MDESFNFTFESLASIGPTMVLVVVGMTAITIVGGLVFLLVRKFGVAAGILGGFAAFLLPACFIAWGLSFLVVRWSRSTESFDSMYAEPIAHKYGWPRDMNVDGIYNISDVWEAIHLGFFMPGDVALIALVKFAPGIGRFLEYSLNDLHGWTAGIFSVASWLIAYVVFKTLFGALFFAKEEAGSGE